MAEMSVINAGIAWAVPVRPDQLGEHLEAYNNLLLVRNALRASHRFGRGVGITKLPLEVLITIEDFLFERVLTDVHAKGTWMEYFRHYESRCEPLDHIDDDDPLVHQVKMELDESGDLCSKCEEGQDSTVCRDGCAETIREEVTEYLTEMGDWHDICYTQRREWEQMIGLGPRGNFVQYNEVCSSIFLTV